MLICLTGLFSSPLTLAQRNVEPSVIPRIQSWAGGTGNFAINRDSRILLPSDEQSLTTINSTISPRSPETLLDVANQLQRAIENITGLSLVVEVGSYEVAGDIYLNLHNYSSPEPDFKRDGYRIQIGSFAHISATTSTGIHYGGVTLLQILRQNYTGSSFTAPQGIIRDFPRYEERQVMLDVARHFMQPEVIKDYLRFMGWYKLNTFHWHLSDWNAMRVDSESLHATDYLGLDQVDLDKQVDASPVIGDFSYDTGEIGEIVQLARELHIEILPELDFPGRTSVYNKWAHVTEGVTEFTFECRELRFSSVGGGLFNAGGFYTMDYTRSDMRNWVTTLFSRLEALFPNSRYIHIGGDEIPNANAQANCQELIDYASGQGIGTGEVFAEYINYLGRARIDNGNKYIAMWTNFEHSSSINPLSSSAVRASSIQNSMVDSLHVIDGDEDTRWGASDGSLPQWIRIDLGSQVSIDSVKIMFNKQGMRTYTHSVEVSADGINYNKVVADDTGSNRSGDTVHTFSSTTGQYVRLNITGISDDSWASVVEIVAYDGSQAHSAVTEPRLRVYAWDNTAWSEFGDNKPYDMVLTGGNGRFLYFTPKSEFIPIATYLYKNWIPTSQSSTKVLGYEMAMWPQHFDDEDIRSEQLIDTLKLPSMAMGDRLWNAAVPSDEYVNHIVRYQSIGAAPGIDSIERVDDGAATFEFLFDEGGGARFADKQGHFQGTLVETLILNTLATNPSWETFGSSRGALNFNGDYTALIYGADLAPPWTVSAWVKLDSRGGNGTLLWSAQYVIQLHAGTTNTVAVYLRDRFSAGQRTIAFTGNNLIATGVWTHVALVGNENSTDLYLDGSLHGTVSEGIALPLGRIGTGKSLREPLNGSVAHLLIFDEELSSTQIHAIYSNTGQSPCD